ncbi:MAG: STAS domain-containing protein, partial [Tannerellaceae bacterium]
IEVGLLLAMVLFLRRVAETTKISVFTDQLSLSDESELYGDNDTLSLPTGVEVYEIEGPFFFGVASKFDEYTKAVGDKPKIRIIRMRRVPFIDSTGVRNLELFVRLSKEEKIDIILSGVNPKVRDVLIRSGFAAKLGEENICDNITFAIERSREMLKTKH